MQKPIQNKQHILPMILSVAIFILFFCLWWKLRDFSPHFSRFPLHDAIIWILKSSRKYSRSSTISKICVWIILLSAINSIFQMVWEIYGTEIVDVRGISWCNSENRQFRYSRISSTIGNIESITENKYSEYNWIEYDFRKKKQSKNFDCCISSWSENSYYAKMGEIHQIGIS